MLDVQEYASAWSRAASLVLEPNPALKHNDKSERKLQEINVWIGYALRMVSQIRRFRWALRQIVSHIALPKDRSGIRLLSLVSRISKVEVGLADNFFVFFISH